MTSVDLRRSTDTPPASQTDTDPAPSEGGPALLPRHVAIVMDGNRRWARLHGLSEGEGHSAGVDAIRPIVEHAAERKEALARYEVVKAG